MTNPEPSDTTARCGRGGVWSDIMADTVRKIDQTLADTETPPPAAAPPTALTFTVDRPGIYQATIGSHPAPPPARGWLARALERITR